MKQKYLIKLCTIAFLFMLPIGLMAQTITGKVTDSNGEGLPYMNVVEKGTTNGTTTDDKGEFSINVKNMTKILIIDDEVDICTLLQKFLERKDFEVETAYLGNDGLKQMTKGVFDLIITDLMMPDVDGFNVIKTMKNDADLSTIPIVVVSAKDLTAREKVFLDTHADMMLQKGSFIDEDFMETIMKKLK